MSDEIEQLVASMIEMYGAHALERTRQYTGRLRQNRDLRDLETWMAVEARIGRMQQPGG